jgi:hypothetical protein
MTSIDKLLEDFDRWVPRLFEAGALGHLFHPYEDLDLTFSDVKDIIHSALSGKLQMSEKVDGQNLMVTWKDGRLKAARNKGQIKNYGERAFTKDGLNLVFANVPDYVRQTFMQAMNDLESGLSSLSNETLNKLFGEGKRFMNLEVMLPTNENVIPYGMNILMFHGLVEFNEEGAVVKTMDATSLESIISDINKDVNKTATVRGPNPISINKFANLKQKESEYLSDLKQIQGQLSDDSSIGDYNKMGWHKFLEQQAEQYQYELPEEIESLLIDRWLYSKKATPINQLVKLIDNPKFAGWVRSFDKDGSAMKNKQINQPIENLFLKLGVDVLSNASGFLAANPSEAAQSISKKLSDTIRQIKSGKNPETLKKLKYELERIKQVGGIEKIVGSEGVVFYRNGKIFKLVGLFSPINQILGMIKFGK